MIYMFRCSAIYLETQTLCKVYLYLYGIVSQLQRKMFGILSIMKNANKYGGLAMLRIVHRFFF